FAIPWFDRLMLGTTDHEVSDPRPCLNHNEVSEILSVCAGGFRKPPTLADVCATFSGIRPLARQSAPSGAVSRISREHHIVATPSGLLSVVGGKWTTYRLIAEQCVDQVLEILNHAPRECRTRDLKLTAPLTPSAASPLVHPELPISEAMIRNAANSLFAVHVTDILTTRTRAAFVNAYASEGALETITAIAANELGKNGAWQRRENERARALLKNFMPNPTPTRDKSD
ncbi:MAG: glycerol-3-phosphate dehydrogenase C-terminal domain-containing protein, partial [Pseudomonadota bacterium]